MNYEAWKETNEQTENELKKSFFLLRIDLVQCNEKILVGQVISVSGKILKILK